MNKKVVKKLNELNKTFYSTVSDHFSESREVAWEGWETLWDRLDEFDTVLDIGCGNGRFLEFLKLKGWEGEYVGFDSSVELLKVADSKHPESNFLEGDILDKDWDIEGKFDLIVIFGVMHHLPGKKVRKEFLEKVADRLKGGGTAVITFWDFTQNENLMKRVVDSSEVGIRKSQLKEGDYILDWRRGKRAFRYCHKYTADEMDALLSNTGFGFFEKFRADGKGGKMNQYVITKMISQF